MKRLAFAIVVLLSFLLLGCQPSATPTPLPPPTATLPPPTATPAPPTATPTPLPTGMSVVVKYTGEKKGGILIYVDNQPPKPNQPPMPLQIATFKDVSSGELRWTLAPASYYITAFFTIGRAPEGPTLPNEPLILCNPIEVKANQNVSVEVILADADAGGKVKDCVKK